MYKNKTFLGLIVARGNSKGVKRKNIRQVLGRPLLAYTAQAAIESKYLDQVVLSTEDDEIAKIGNDFGVQVPFMRPPKLAQDDTSSAAVVSHAILELKLLGQEFDYIFLLQPTSPLRNSRDIDGCVQFCIDNQAASCVSVTAFEKSPTWLYEKADNGKLSSFFDSKTRDLRRQDSPKLFSLNGAMFLIETKTFLKEEKFILKNTLGYEMPIERSLDIDSEYDLKLFELLMAEKRN